MTNNDNQPPALTPEARAHFMALCAELEDAAGARDGDRAVKILHRISAEVSPEVGRFMTEGLADRGFARLAARMGEDDPVAYGIMRDLMAEKEQFGKPSKVDQLVGAWRNANDRYGRLNGRWPLVRLVMWPAALLTVVLLATGSSASAPALLALAGLVVTGVHIERVNRADIALVKAWDDLADYTGLSDEELVRLVRDDDEEAE
jgi:hypothetical protein